MTVQQKCAPKRTARKRVSEAVLPSKRPADLRSPADCLLRDVAFVLHATAMVRRSMEAEQTIYSSAS